MLNKIQHPDDLCKVVLQINSYGPKGKKTSIFLNKYHLRYCQQVSKAGPPFTVTEIELRFINRVVASLQSFRKKKLSELVQTFEICFVKSSGVIKCLRFSWHTFVPQGCAITL